MAEKRGIDRAVLKLINAYEYGIYSDVEADDFKQKESTYQPSQKQKDVILRAMADGKINAEYLQKEYGSSERGVVEVCNFWIRTEMLNRSVQFHTCGWRDELHLGACFNTSFYEKEFGGCPKQGSRGNADRV